MNYLNFFGIVVQKFALPILLVFANIYVFTSFSYAAPGRLDQSFGASGIVISPIGARTDQANAVAVQSDGKIVVVGRRFSNPYNDFAVMRYNPSGTLDTSFDGDGIVITSVSLYSDYAWDVAIQPDGKIVVVGYSNGVIAIVRYNPNGSLDPTFDGDGQLTTSFDGTGGTAEAVTIQPDGKIVIIGAIFGTNNGSIAVYRLNENGSLDTSFGNNGRAVTTTNFANGQIYDVALQSDGKIVVCGDDSFNSTQSFAVARYNSNGTMDNSFDNDGVVNTPIGSSYGSAYSVSLQTDGKIVVGGYVNTFDSGADFALARYNENGSLDSSFGLDGKVITNVSNNNSDDVIVTVNVQPNGKVIAAGRSRNSSTNNDFALVRYNLNGTLDTSFGTGGKTITAIGGAGGLEDFATDAVLQPDGKIVIAGYTGASTGHNFAIARYLNSGSNSFDYDGDGKADVSVFRPSNGVWYLNQSTNGFTGITFGQLGDKIVPADYDGDGKADVAVYRNGTWYLLRSSTGFTGVAFGASTDIPAPADFDGDGKAELCVYRPSSGTWYLYNLVNNQISSVTFGASEDKPVPVDFDGDGKANIALFRPSTGMWFTSTNPTTNYGAVQFGSPGDLPVPADYDGDGKADVAVFRPSNGNWYIQQSTAGFAGFAFGLGTDLAVVADYDGDGKSDVAVFRNGNWYLQRSQVGFVGIAFGEATDKPTPNASMP